MNATMRAEIGVLRQDVAALAEKLAGVGVAGDVLLVRGGVEVLPAGDNDGGSILPTVVADGLVYTDELRCERARVQDLRVRSLRVDGDAPVFGPTGCRGPPGYATHTGATGPRGLSRFAELEDCPSEYRAGACLVATPTGIGYGGLAFSGRSVACRLVRAGALVRRNGVWCHELGEAVFSARLEGGSPVRVVLGLVGGPARLEFEQTFLTPDGGARTVGSTISVPEATAYREVCLDPVDVPQAALLQATLTNTGGGRAYVVHMSATQ